MKFLQTLGLKSKNPDTRRETIENLARESDSSLLKHLYPMLDDKDASVRREAVKAIASFREGETVPHLKKCFVDSDRDVRTLAAGALGKILVPEAVHALLDALRDKDFALRKKAAAVLEARGWRPSTSEESILNALAAGRFEEVAAEGEDAIEFLASVLQAESPTIRQEAIKALSTIESPNTFRFISIGLKDSEASVRFAAVDALQRVRDARIFDPLLEAIVDSDPGVRQIAVEALGNIGGVRAVAPLVSSLKDVSMPVRMSAINGLGNIGDARAVAPLIGILQGHDRERDVLVSAAQALGKLGDRRAIAPLMALLEDSEMDVRSSAKSALYSIDPNWQHTGSGEGLPELQNGFHDPEAGSTAPKLHQIPKMASESPSLQMENERSQTAEDFELAGLQPLFTELQDSDPATRYRAVAQLGKIQNSQAIPALFQALYDEEDGVRKAAAEVLELLGWQPGDDSQYAWHAVVLRRWDAAIALGPAAVDAVIKALEIFDPSSQKAAAQTLGMLGDARAVDSLLQALNAKDFGIRKAAAEALGNLGDPRALTGLMEARGDGFKPVRDAVEQAILKIGGS